jgi:hypothetical protein
LEIHKAPAALPNPLSLSFTNINNIYRVPGKMMEKREMNMRERERLLHQRNQPPRCGCKQPPCIPSVASSSHQVTTKRPLCVLNQPLRGRIEPHCDLKQLPLGLKGHKVDIVILKNYVADKSCYAARNSVSRGLCQTAMCLQMASNNIHVAASSQYGLKIKSAVIA